ncbi:MAG: hypothetical protein HPY94_01520 [Clostridia bacterium]|nr:hypothetical protein [Clostridia bacterium]
MLDVKQFFLEEIRFHISFSRLRKAVKLAFKTPKAVRRKTEKRSCARLCAQKKPLVRRTTRQAQIGGLQSFSTIQPFFSKHSLDKTKAEMLPGFPFNMLLQK